MIYLPGKDVPDVFATHGAGLVDAPEGARGIRLADRDYVAKHNPGMRSGDLPKVCVEDGVGMGSSIYCYMGGSWALLAGAD
jgi:hypothetical protein